MKMRFLLRSWWTVRRLFGCCSIHKLKIFFSVLSLYVMLYITVLYCIILCRLYDFSYLLKWYVLVSVWHDWTMLYDYNTFMNLQTTIWEYIYFIYLYGIILFNLLLFWINFLCFYIFSFHSFLILVLVIT